MTTPYDDAVRERFNALAVKVAKLEQENAALRANQLPAGAVCPTGETRVAMPGEWFLWYDGCIIERKGRDNTGQSYPIYRRVEAHGADDHFVDANKLVAERDALRQEVERLKGESKANQEAADVLRLIEASGINEVKRCIGGPWQVRGPRSFGWNFADTLAVAVERYCATFGITLPAKDEQPASVDRSWNKFADDDVPSEPAAECETASECESVHQQLAEARAEIERLKESCKSVSDLSIKFAKIDKANLDAKNAEIESLRRCRDAWDAVRKYNILVLPGKLQVDPIESVLELAKTLEKGG